MAASRPKYNPDYDDILVMVNRDRVGLGLEPLETAVNVPTEPVVVSSYGAWKRATHSPNAALIAKCQQYFVHDIAERTIYASGKNVATCTCGLEVTMAPVTNTDDIDHEAYYPKYFAENRRKSIEWERAFFAAPGHRDPFHKTVLGGFLIRVKGLEVEAEPRLELQCQQCGWLGPTTLDASWAEFGQFNHRVFIDFHNWNCPGKGVEVWDEDVFLVHHDPLGAFKAERRKQQANDKAAELNVDDDE